MKRITVLIFLPLLAFGHPFEIHSKHWLFGLPEGTPDTNDLIIRDAYALSSNDDTKFADWVAYRLTPEETFGTISGERNFRADPFLDEDETLERDDYVGAFDLPLRYHKGHQAPLAHYKGSVNISDTNFLSNITPQKGSLNSGRWLQLESRVRNRSNYVLLLTDVD